MSIIVPPLSQIKLIMGTNSSHQSIFSNNNPLFSSIVTLYTLILLYFPQLSLNLIFSPLLISTLILLFFLLRLGASQQLKPPPPPSSFINNSGGSAFAQHALPHNLTQNGLNFIEDEHLKKYRLEPEPKLERGVETQPRPKVKPEPNMVGLVLMQEEAGKVKEYREEAQPALEPETYYDQGQSTNQCLGCWAEPEPTLRSKNLLQWDVGAPLEVIYEGYEGEEEGEVVQNDEFWRTTAWCNKAGKIERYPSLSCYYPETDSDSDSDSEDEEREGLIEIGLDNGFSDKRIINVMVKVAEKQEEFHFDDEDNLIEIDISSTKNMYDFAW